MIIVSRCLFMKTTFHGSTVKWHHCNATTPSIDHMQAKKHKIIGEHMISNERAHYGLLVCQACIIMLWFTRLPGVYEHIMANVGAHYDLLSAVSV